MPTSFFEVIVTDLSTSPSLTGLCVCYELGEWREKAFVDYLFEWLPEFALTWSERQDFSDQTAVALLRRAAHIVYETDKYQRRGEFGELVLHAVAREVFDAEPAISKIYFKSATNETVKGFDSVHVVEAANDLELWLGEAKFYGSISSALSEAATSLAEHFDQDYMRSEATLIVNKLDPQWPHTAKVRSLLDSNVSLDRIFERITVPVLGTYDSPTVGSHDFHSQPYADAFDAEVRQHLATFAAKPLPTFVTIRLILVPIKNKSSLVAALHAKLLAWQNL